MPTATESDAAALFRFACKVCQRKGFTVNDPEYGSAINLAVWRGMETYKDDGPASLRTYCTVIAIRECFRLRRQLDKWKPVRESPLLSRPTRTTPVSELDFETLSFAARHGRTRAAKLLGMQLPAFTRLLRRIAEKVEQKDWPD